MVEGSPRPTRCNDHLDDAFDIAQYVAGRNADRAKAESRDAAIASCVTPDFVRVNFAIDLDSEADLETGKIKPVAIQWMLAPELEAAGPGAQHAPKNDFGKVTAAAFLASTFDRFRRGAENPSTTLRVVPLPVPGRYRRLVLHHIRNTPNCARSGVGASRVTASARPSTSRVWAGSITPSSHRRAVA